MKKMSSSTVQITDLVRVCPGVYASDSSLVMASNKDDWAYTIHVCNPVWTDEYNTGMDVTSYIYSNVADSYRKVVFHSLADVQVYCILHGHKCYCSCLSRNQGSKTTDSIKHTLTLYPSPVVTPNISWPDIVRTKACGRVTWEAIREGILTCEEQQLLENVSKKLYKQRLVTPLKAYPRPLHEDICLGNMDLTSTSCSLMARNETIGRVGDMLFICQKKMMGDNEDEPELSFTDVMIYFPCRGGSSSAIQRLKGMLISLLDKKEDTATPILSVPLTMCDSCGDKAVVLYANEDGCSFILCQPIAVTVDRGCKQHPAGPVHLFLTTLKDVAWLEREILCCQDDPYVDTLSERIEKALQPCMGGTGV